MANIVAESIARSLYDALKAALPFGWRCWGGGAAAGSAFPGWEYLDESGTVQSLLLGALNNTIIARIALHVARVHRRLAHRMTSAPALRTIRTQLQLAAVLETADATHPAIGRLALDTFLLAAALDRNSCGGSLRLRSGLIQTIVFALNSDTMFTAMVHWQRIRDAATDRALRLYFSPQVPALFDPQSGEAALRRQRDVLLTMLAQRTLTARVQFKGGQLVSVTPLYLQDALFEHAMRLAAVPTL